MNHPSRTCSVKEHISERAQFKVTIQEGKITNVIFVYA